MKKPGRRKRNANVESGREAAIDDARATKAMFCLFNLMTVARSQADVATWISEGGMELEDLYEALTTGADHPVLRRWKRRRTANRPPPDSRERLARRLAHLLQVALVRAQLTKNAAREMIVEALAQDWPTSKQAMEHWQRDESPLTEADEQVISTALDRCGHDHKLLVIYFVGLIQVRTNPFVKLIPEQH